jgi:5-methyltetrahydrofolate--homocysteine methyltransferase
MVNVAKEMERNDLDIPLLIGGATTSRVHTAVKIERNYAKNQTVHVNDASRSVTVVERLLSKEKDKFIGEIRKEYEKIRLNHAGKKSKKEFLTIQDARTNALVLDWSNYQPPVPKFLGVKTFEEYSLREISRYIDWTPFFQTWDLHGRFPRILEDEVVGKEATKVYADASEMLKEIITNKWLQPKAVIGIWEADRSAPDTIDVYENGEVIHQFEFVRQQIKKAKGQPNLSLADFIAPKSSGKKDYIGGFAVTTGVGIEKHLKRFEENKDDYNSIMLNALADRLAQALAELMHEKVRKDFWGYAEDESLKNEELIKEKYRGIRPASGYPACPDHTEKRILFDLLKVQESTGIELTESCAMLPASSVSGWYFAHPESRYFGVGKSQPIR